MDLQELRIFTAEALGKDPLTLPENPTWDSLDQLEIITNLHDRLGEKVGEADLDNFTDLESLAAILRERGLVD
jgi:acyl carrier protein